MRSLFTPSRIIVVVVTFSLLGFLWTFGLPSQLGRPSLPIIQHPADEAKLHDPEFMLKELLDEIARQPITTNAQRRASEETADAVAVQNANVSSMS